MKRKRKLTEQHAKSVRKSRGEYAPSRGVFKGRHFASKRAYENALARLKGFPSRYAEQRAARPVFTRSDAKWLTAAELDARDRALDSVARMRREGMSLERAARLSDTTVNAVIRHAGTALRKDARGRWIPTKLDKLYREMVTYTDQGRITIEVTDSRTATTLARYIAAVDHFRETGSRDQLREFERRSIRAGKVKYPFLTDSTALRRIIHAGEIATEGPYAH